MDYTDPQRAKNVQLAKNVKIVEPNTSVIYACPVKIEGTERISLVIVAPKDLDVVEGDILCSPQSGGIMHKIVTEATDGAWYFLFLKCQGLNPTHCSTTLTKHTKQCMATVQFFHLQTLKIKARFTN